MSGETRELILKNDGTPYATEAAAKMAMSNKRLDDEGCEIVPHEGGFAIRVLGDSAPLPDGVEPDSPSAEFLRLKDTNIDEVREALIAHGFIRRVDKLKQPIAEHRLTEKARKMLLNDEDAEQVIPTVKALIEAHRKVFKVLKVRFHAKAKENDPDDVVLSCNAEKLVFQREQEVFVPGMFLEVSDHAVFQTFKQLPNEQRKVTGTIRKYPYDILGEGTMDDYLLQRREGTRKTKENLAKYGPDGNPEVM